MIKYLLFVLLCLIYIIIWLFVLFAFINIKLAKINLSIVIPFIYVAHILPFHILERSKQMLYPENHTSKLKSVSKILKISDIYTKLQSNLSQKCYFSLISPHGMLIFGALTSSYVLLNSPKEF